MIGAIGTWGGWPVLTALGTVGAVVVAVGLQAWLEFKQRRSRPDVTLRFDAHMTADEKNPVTGAVIPYLRLAATNADGKDTAEDVEVLILGIEEFAVSQIGSGGHIVWLANPALGWANSVDPLPRMSIPPGSTRYVDVGCWLQPMSTGFDPRRLSFVLSVVPEPGSERHVLEPGGWRIRLALTPRNADATFWEVELSYAERVDQGLARPVDVHATIRELKSATA